MQGKKRGNRTRIGKLRARKLVKPGNRKTQENEAELTVVIYTGLELTLRTVGGNRVQGWGPGVGVETRERRTIPAEGGKK